MAAQRAYFARLGLGRFSSRDKPLSVRDGEKITIKSNLILKRDSKLGSLFENWSSTLGDFVLRIH